MRNKAIAISAAVVIVLGVVIFRWNDWLYIPAIIAVVAVFWMLRKVIDRLNAVPPRYQRHESRAKPKALVPRVLAGIGVGMLNVAAAMSVHGVFLMAPSVQEIVWDRDRATFEQICQRLRQNARFAELAELIDARLAQPVSNCWAEELRNWEYELWIKAGKQVGGEKSRSYYLKAIAVADQTGIPHELADELIERLSDSRRMIAMEIDHKQNTHRSQEAYREVCTNLNNTAAIVFDQFIQWGDSLGDQFDLRRTKYEAAAAWAKRHSLNSELAMKRLAALQVLVDSRSPAKLPPGTSVRLLREQVDSRPPVVVLDVAVHDSAGKPNRNLTAKDFHLQSGGQLIAATHCVLVTPEGRPIQLVTLIDRSKSTAGPAIEAAKTGVKSFLRSVNGTAAIKLFAFGDAVEPLTDWTTDIERVVQVVDSVQANGSTAFLKGLAAAIAELESRPEPRAIALLTDGKDHVGGPALAELIARCRKASIAVHAVGLKTPELDSAALQQLSQLTGGSYQMADSISDLSRRFESVASLLRTPFYRIVVPDDGKAGRQFELQVGQSTPAARLSARSSR
jgi:hypothetical protein